MAHQGYFRPLNPGKYKGNPTNIIYRSSWELRVMNYLDKHPDVIEWQSEEFFIPYISPVDNKTHRYYPDFWIKKKNPQGIVEVDVVEIKPKSQMTAPKKTQKVTKRFISEVYTWGVNQAKWKAATTFCMQRNWNFKILNEQDLGITF